MMSFFSYKIGSKKGYMEMGGFFTLGFIWSAPDESIIHYYCTGATTTAKNEVFIRL